MKYTLLLVLAMPGASLAAQQTNVPATTPARPDSGAPAVARRPTRASWFTDKRPLQVGDLLAVVVDEQTSASERVVNTASSKRSQNGALNGELFPETFRSIGMGMDASSDQQGVANRTGGLSAAVTVRVTAIDASGNARIEGHKLVSIDGRKQEIILNGVVRPEDVSSSNMVLSSRIADAEITYKGKKISPKQGIFGKLIGIFWP